MIEFCHCTRTPQGLAIQTDRIDCTVAGEHTEIMFYLLIESFYLPVCLCVIGGASVRSDTELQVKFSHKGRHNVNLNH